MAKELLEYMEEPIEERMEWKINVSDILMLILILLGFLAGLYTGMNIQHGIETDFYGEYLTKCDCIVPLLEENGHVSYALPDNQDNRFGFLFHNQT